MWKKDRFHVGLVDSEIIQKGFLMLEGSTLQYSFQKGQEIPFERHFWTPTVYLFKVHRDNPLLVQSSGTGSLYVYPAKELKKKNQRMPSEVYQDKNAWDITTFLMLPFLDGDFGSWHQYKIPDGFTSVSGEKGEGSLLYLNHGSIHVQDSLVAFNLMPSQVISYLNHWMYEGRKINSHEKTFNQKLEGMVSVPHPTRFNVLQEITSELEKNYRTRLSFKD